MGGAGDGAGEGYAAERARGDAARARLARLRAEAVQRAAELDRSPRLHAAVQRLRRGLPGDPHFGDPLSLGGARHAEAAGRALVRVAGDRPGVARELGLGGLQVWQAALERLGRDSGAHDVVLVFTDLAGFSTWALGAGDEAALRALRQVARAWEPPVTERAGTVVKRLGDGLMAAFADPAAAVDAVLEGRDRLRGVSVEGWQPLLRAGLHAGRPRRVGGDYVGVSVNTAARLAESARADEVLVSGDLLDRLDAAARARLAVRRRRFGLSLKGAPEGLTVHAVDRAG